ncbi:FAD-dependent oxidoreductase [Marinobacter sp. NFXS9]|uniref:FAD-dependent oxidoreductase n=1 Tax=Marinobacter sp. NFXS9 TaxID=2818433 RepID=UPI0032DFADDF
MASLTRVLIIGGGFTGMSAGIELRKAGIDVDLVEIDPSWRPEGAGISISGATLRALMTIGVYHEVKARGYLSTGLDVYTATGDLITSVPTPPPAGANVEGGGAIMRPVLARILADATVAVGVNVRLGTTFTRIEPLDDGADVTFTDGTRQRYDLVIGADGLHSKVRETLFPDAPKPQYIGQAVWRAILPRPADIIRPTMWVGQSLKVGVNPVSDDQMYMFMTENRPTNEYVDRSDWPTLMSEALRTGFPAERLQQAAPQLLEDSARVDFRSLLNLLVPQPWRRGRVILIGDTVHATTPHLASGAGIGIESALALAEELQAASTVDDALGRFERRRWDRCRMVVENSARLAEIEINGGDKAEHAQLMRSSMEALTQPI